MIWRNHRLVTGSLVFALTGHLLPAFIARYASVFPDSTEGDDYDDILWIIRRGSRTFTHCLSLYAAAFAAIAYYFDSRVGRVFFFLSDTDIARLLTESLETKQPEGVIFIAMYVALWFVVGCLMHMAEDFFCGGIPIFDPADRVGFQWFYVASPQENVIAWVIMLGALALRYFNVEPFVYGV